MNEAQAVSLGAVLLGAAIFGLVIWILLVIAHWKMFTKAGVPGWKSLIPIYSDYTLFQIVWDTKNFLIYMGLILVTILTMVFGGAYAIVDGQIVVVGEGNFIMGLLCNAAYIGVVIYMVLLAIRTSFAYGKRMMFAVGLFFLPNIFTLMLAFGSAKYVGRQE